MKSITIRLSIFPVSIVVLIFLFNIFFIWLYPNHHSFTFSFVVLKVPSIKISSLINLNAKTMSLIVDHFSFIDLSFWANQNTYSMSFAFDYCTDVNFSLIECHFRSSKFYHILEGDSAKGKGLIGHKVFRNLFWFKLTDLNQLSLSGWYLLIHLC